MILPDAKTLRQLLADNDGRLIFQAVLPIDGTPSLAYAEPESAPVPSGPGATHSPDFASVNWFGTVYGFTPTQRRIVSVLWNAYNEGAPDVSERTILEEADSDSANLRMLFRGHPALGRMIQRSSQHGGPPGCFRLVRDL